MPSIGWDWTELQEQVLRTQRIRERNKLSLDEIENLYLAEIDNLQDRIRELEGQISSRPLLESVGTDEEDFSGENLVRRIGPEIYTGEISDRIRYAARRTLSVADQIGLDRRSKVILERITTRIPPSSELEELLQDLARATKDPRRAKEEVVSVLSRCGYRKKSDNKHVRLDAGEEFDGLDTITVQKTPSDRRGLKNLCKQIERTLGINRLDE